MLSAAIHATLCCLGDWSALISVRRNPLGVVFDGKAVRPRESRALAESPTKGNSLASLPTEANPFWFWIPQIRLVSASSISFVTDTRVLSGQPAQSCHQGCQPWPVFLTHCCELQSQTATRFHVSYVGVGTYLAFLHKEVEVNDRSHGLERGCLEEQTAHAHIPHGGDISPSVAAPVDPNVS